MSMTRRELIGHMAGGSVAVAAALTSAAPAAAQILNTTPPPPDPRARRCRSGGRVRQLARTSSRYQAGGQEAPRSASPHRNGSGLDHLCERRNGAPLSRRAVMAAAAKARPETFGGCSTEPSRATSTATSSRQRRDREPPTAATKCQGDRRTRRRGQARRLGHGSESGRRAANHDHRGERLHYGDTAWR